MKEEYQLERLYKCLMTMTNIFLIVIARIMLDIFGKGIWMLEVLKLFSIIVIKRNLRILFFLCNLM